MYQSSCLYVSFFLHQSKLYAVKQSGIKYVLVEEKKFECFWLKKYSLPEKNYVWASNPKQSPCGENWDLCDLIFTRVSSYLNLDWHEKLFPHQICCQAVVANVSKLHWKKSGRKCVGNPEKNWRHISRVTDSTPCRFADAPKLQFCLALALNRGNVPRSRVNSKNAQNLSKNVNMCTLCIKCVRYCCVASNSAAAGID